MTTPRGGLRLGALAVAALMLSGCGIFGTSAAEEGAADGAAGGSGTAGSAGSGTAGLTGAALDVDPSVLPQESVAPTPTMRLADGLVPPTNRWFSGLVFGAGPQPVFPVPLAFGVTDGGYAFTLPEIVTSEKAILGSYGPQVGVDVGATSTLVSAYDTVSVSLDLLDDAGEALGTVTIAEGSPLVSYTAATAQTATLSQAVSAGDVPGTWTTEVGGRDYVLVGDGLEASDVSDDGRAVGLDAGDPLVWFPVPDELPGGEGDAVERLAAAAARPLTGTSLAYGVDEDVTTTAITYLTGGPDDAADDGTAIVRLPHQQGGTVDGQDVCDLGTYRTVYGTADLCLGNELAWSSPTLAPRGALDLDGLADADRAELVEQVRADAAAREALPSDTYFGGKALARDTNLLVLADQLGLDDVAAPLRTELTDAVREWAEPDGCETRDARCFVYDPVLRGVVGKTPSFGSEEFNDHHFHYGYFLYTAGVLAADDPELAAELAPVVDLLAADVANGATTDDFPALRVFGAYRGSSWASGYSPFADGNNQESSSEAVSAWNGLALWAGVRGLDDLETQATWLLSQEAAAARAYWTDLDLDDPVYDGFEHTITSLNWGGKRDYATWFSAEPSAMLGILVLPMSPAADYLAGDPERIRANVADALAGEPQAAASWDVMFGDYLLMYAALAGPDDAAASLEVARGLPEERLDDGLTRSYLLAWIMAYA
ncbi:glycosyl hydrolase [Oerskovia flava]|uniref:glycosyl hydrolase n=1 Tax=Oerskovia flava TaxID=2986422 RepID=UPI00223F000C|nr:glycosyl hydrolase [Oerskovia sp. JB1-3-2]